jgi:hypothetical protein
MVIQGHTLVPYVRAFSRAQTPEDVISSLSSYLLPLTRVVSVRRFCPACVAEQIKTFGESFWCRAHHLPGVDHCPKHFTPLLQTSLSALGGFGTMLLPHELSGERAAHVPTRPRSSLQKLALRSVVALAQAPERRGAPYYLGLAVRYGWLRQGEKISSALLSKTLVQYFGERFLRGNGMSALSQAAAWFALLLRHGSPSQSPTWKHLALEELLRNGNSQLVCSIGYKPAGTKKNYQELDAFVTRELASHIKVVDKLGGSLTRTDLLRQSGVLHLYRHRWKSLPATQAILMRFSASASCAKPLSPMAFPVQESCAGRRRVSRAELIVSGELLGAKATAKRLGLHWTEMAKMTREGRIVTVTYQGRHYYPALWPSLEEARARFEAVTCKLMKRPGLQAYSLLVAPRGAFSGRSVAQVLLGSDAAASMPQVEALLT